METAAQIPGLLLAIDDKVRRAPSDPSLEGRVSIGVKRGAGGCLWWTAHFAGTTSTQWSSTIPEFDAALGVDETTAQQVLEGTVLPQEGLCIKTGDFELLERFCTAFFGPPKGMGSLALRARSQTSRARETSRLRRKRRGKR